MKVLIEQQKGGTGKAKFFNRLVPALRDLGVDAGYDVKHADVALAGQFFKTDIGHARKVIRVDGVHLEKDHKYDYRRHLVKKAMKHADAVIYQSLFAQRMLNGILGVHPARQHVIYNGADPKDYQVEEIPRDVQKYVIISGRYAGADVRPHKRFETMLRIAKKYSERMPDDIRFWIAGKNTENRQSDYNIRFLGDVPELMLRRYLKSSDVMLNLAWFDWCPNSVVEALVAGTPVICSNNSGVAELVQGCGIVLPLDKEIPAKLIKKNKPPAIDEDMVIQALDKALWPPETFYRIACPRLNIDNIAAQYKTVFDEVLK